LKVTRRTGTMDRTSTGMTGEPISTWPKITGSKITISPLFLFTPSNKMVKSTSVMTKTPAGPSTKNTKKLAPTKENASHPKKPLESISRVIKRTGTICKISIMQTGGQTLTWPRIDGSTTTTSLTFSQ
jgi:hypothetical protein